ncbi:MAG: oxaloacetate decarboxylase, partial [Pseudomonadales bacterium 32-61-5]
EVYTVQVNGKSFVVQVDEGGDIEGIKPLGAAPGAAPAPAGDVPAAVGGEPQTAPLAGNIFKVLVQPGQSVQEGDLVIILEAMKMETEIRAFKAGTVSGVSVKVGDAVSVGDCLLTIA